MIKEQEPKSIVVSSYNNDTLKERYARTTIIETIMNQIA